LAKNWMVILVLGVLSTLPVTTVFEPLVIAELITGKFCRLFGPASASLGSFGVTPSSLRSIPRALLEKIELVRIALPALLLQAIGLPALSLFVTLTPRWPLKAITLPNPTAPPIVLFMEPALICTPAAALPRAR